MKKFLIMLFICLFTFIGCGNKTDNKTDDTTDNTTNNTTNNTTDKESNNSSKPTLSFKTLDVSGKNVYGKVSNDTETFSFLDEIEVGSDTTYKVFLDMYGDVDVPTKTVSLEIGDNIFYILEKTSNQEKLYTVTIRRKPTYRVQFTDGTFLVAPTQYVEEGEKVIEPSNPTKNGHDFICWNIDFPVTITSNTEITSNWKINWGKMLELDGSTIVRKKYSYSAADAREIVIPSTIDGITVTKIGGSAFSGMEWTKSIEMPDTVTHIEKSAFRDCDRLEKVVLSKNLEYIGEMAFDYCISLKTIEFNGTINEWNEITKGENWNRKVPATEVICSDGTVSLN